MKILFILILLITSFFCLSQKIKTTECEKFSPKSIDSIKISITLKEGLLLFQSGNKIQAIEKYKTAVCFSQKINNQTFEAKSTDGLGLIYAQSSEFYDAYICFKKALELYKTENYINGIASASSHLGNTLRYLGNHTKALDYMYDALRMCKDLKDEDGIAKNCINIALTLQEFKNYEGAIKYNNLALKIYEEKKDTAFIGTVYNNLGTIYQDQQQYKKALYFYKKAYYLGEKCNSCFQIGSTIGNIGLIHLENQNYKLALEYQYKSLEYSTKNDFKEAQADAFNSIGIIFAKQDKKQDAITYFHKAFDLSLKYGFEKTLINASKELATIYNELGDEHNALKYLKINSEHNEKLINKEKIQQINDTKAKYEIEQYESEITELQNKKQIDFLQKSILISSIILITT